jgi:hypothetical protein
MSPAEGLETALQLFELAVDMLRARLRRERPGISDAEVEEAVRAWVRHRPGAEHGDCAGPPATRLREP